MKTITREQLYARLNSGEPTVVIEALPKKYFEAEHIPGAINIPHDEILKRAATELPDKNATIVVYCASTPCQNSKIATQALTSLGYQNAFEYVEGKADWKEAGLPLVAA